MISFSPSFGGFLFVRACCVVRLLREKLSRTWSVRWCCRLRGKKEKKKTRVLASNDPFQNKTPKKTAWLDTLTLYLSGRKMTMTRQSV
jgi:hypothetical protein